MYELHQDPFIDYSIWLQHCLRARVRRVLFDRKEEEGAGEQEGWRGREKSKRRDRDGEGRKNFHHALRDGTLQT